MQKYTPIPLIGRALDAQILLDEIEYQRLTITNDQILFVLDALENMTASEHWQPLFNRLVAATERRENLTRNMETTNEENA